MKPVPTYAFIAVLITLIAAQSAQSQEWTRFRGPNGTGISEAEGIPTVWTEEDYNWTAELPGIGHSSPVLWGDKIFLTSAREEGAIRTVLCLSAADGRILWSKDYESTPHAKHARNSFASPTPAVDSERVYVAWSAPEKYTLLALDHYGNPAWDRDLGPYISQHSCGTSPILYDNMVVIGNDQDAPGESFLLAVDSHTGEDRWRTPRKSARVAYSTPCVYRPADGEEQLIFNSMAHGISGIDPTDGATLWEREVFDKRSVSSPIVVAGNVFGSCGSGAGGNYVVAVRPGDAAKNIETEEAYRVDRQAPYVPTPVAKGELVFLWSDKGIVTCINARTGESLWQERIRGNFSGSPIRVGDALYCISDDGDVFVLAATDEFKQLAKIPLGETSRSTPAVADGTLYLRTESHLFSVGGKKK